MTHLPDDLIIQILMRLPVKSLLRFRCVSKSWLSLISDPHFAISHFELAAAPTYRLLYLPTTDYDSQTRSIDFDASLLTHSASATLNLSFLPPNSCFNIMGSCRGFLLLSDSFYLYLWNPSTGVHKPLSFSPVTSNLDVSLLPFFYGLGYDPSTDDYLIVLACYGPDPAADFKTYFELFSLRANAWNEIEGTHLPYSSGDEQPRAGTLLNGVIHWLALRYDVSVDVILAFDLMERSFSEVPLPDDFDQESRVCDLCVLGGSLCLCVRDGGSTDIWVMEQYKVQSSWTKSIVVTRDDLSTQLCYSICYTKSGDIVGMDTSTGLVKYNAKGQLLEHRSYCDDPLGCDGAMYTGFVFNTP